MLPSTKEIPNKVHEASTLISLTFVVLLIIFINVNILVVLVLHLCEYGLLHGNHLLLIHALPLFNQSGAMMSLHPSRLRLLQLVNHLLKLCLRRSILLHLLLLPAHQQLIRINRSDVVGEVGLPQPAIPRKVTEGHGCQRGELGYQEVTVQGTFVQGRQQIADNFFEPAKASKRLDRLTAECGPGQRAKRNGSHRSDRA